MVYFMYVCFSCVNKVTVSYRHFINHHHININYILYFSLWQLFLIYDEGERNRWLKWLIVKLFSTTFKMSLFCVFFFLDIYIYIIWKSCSKLLIAKKCDWISFFSDRIWSLHILLFPVRIAFGLMVIIVKIFYWSSLWFLFCWKTIPELILLAQNGNNNEEVYKWRRNYYRSHFLHPPCLNLVLLLCFSLL